MQLLFLSLIYPVYVQKSGCPSPIHTPWFQLSPSGDDTKLLGGLEHVSFFPSYWEFHHPNWRTHISYFSEGLVYHQAEKHICPTVGFSPIKKLRCNFFDPTIDAAEIPPLSRRIYEHLLALHHILPTIFPSTLAKSNHSRIIPIVREELSQYTPCCPKQCVLKSLISYRMGPPLDSVNRCLISGWILWFMLDITN